MIDNEPEPMIKGYDTQNEDETSTEVIGYSLGLYQNDFCYSFVVIALLYWFISVCK